MWRSVCLIHHFKEKTRQRRLIAVFFMDKQETSISSLHEPSCCHQYRASCINSGLLPCLEPRGYLVFAVISVRLMNVPKLHKELQWHKWWGGIAEGRSLTSKAEHPSLYFLLPVWMFFHCELLFWLSLVRALTYSLLLHFLFLRYLACRLYISLSLCGCWCHIFPNVLAISTAVNCGFDLWSLRRFFAMKRKKGGSGCLSVLKLTRFFCCLLCLFLTLLRPLDALFFERLGLRCLAAFLEFFFPFLDMAFCLPDLFFETFLLVSGSWLVSVFLTEMRSSRWVVSLSSWSSSAGLTMLCGLTHGVELGFQDGGEEEAALPAGGVAAGAHWDERWWWLPWALMTSSSQS